MSDLILQDAGCLHSANAFAARANAVGLRLRLFKNDYTPTVDSVAADFTEADFNGYAAALLNDYGAASVSGNIASTQPAPRFFTKLATGTINLVYGYYLQPEGSSDVLWAERFVTTTPADMSDEGATIVVIAKRTFQSKYVS